MKWEGEASSPTLGPCLECCKEGPGPAASPMARGHSSASHWRLPVVQLHPLPNTLYILAVRCLNHHSPTLSRGAAPGQPSCRMPTHVLFKGLGTTSPGHSELCSPVLCISRNHLSPYIPDDKLYPSNFLLFIKIIYTRRT